MTFRIPKFALFGPIMNSPLSLCFCKKPPLTPASVKHRHKVFDIMLTIRLRGEYMKNQSSFWITQNTCNVLWEVFFQKVNKVSQKHELPWLKYLQQTFNWNPEELSTNAVATSLQSHRGSMGQMYHNRESKSLLVIMGPYFSVYFILIEVCNELHWFLSI